MVNLVHSDGTKHYPIDYRIYDNTADGKTKNDHFRDMLINAIADKGIQAKTVLFDSWYAAWENLKLVNSLKLTFYTTLKCNGQQKPDTCSGNLAVKLPFKFQRRFIA